MFEYHLFYNDKEIFEVSLCNQSIVGCHLQTLLKIQKVEKQVPHIYQWLNICLSVFAWHKKVLVQQDNHWWWKMDLWKLQMKIIMVKFRRAFNISTLSTCIWLDSKGILYYELLENGDKLLLCNTSVSLLEWCIGRENAFSSKEIKFDFAAWWHLSCDAANDHKPAEFFHKQCILQLCHLPTITYFVLCYTNLSAQELHQVQDIKEVKTNIVCLMMKKAFSRKENDSILTFKKVFFKVALTMFILK